MTIGSLIKTKGNRIKKRKSFIINKGLKELEKKRPIKYIILGIFLFLLRYVPVYKTGGIFNDYMSLSQGSKLCSTWLGSMAPQCNWVTPLDWIVIVASLGLIIYGGYLKFKT